MVWIHLSRRGMEHGLQKAHDSHLRAAMLRRGSGARRRGGCGRRPGWRRPCRNGRRFFRVQSRFFRSQCSLSRFRNSGPHKADRAIQQSDRYRSGRIAGDFHQLPDGQPGWRCARGSRSPRFWLHGDRSSRHVFDPTQQDRGGRRHSAERIADWKSGLRAGFSRKPPLGGVDSYLSQSRAAAIVTTAK
jgi:hypothetical protein